MIPDRPDGPQARPALLGLATAVPPTRIGQSDLLGAAQDAFGDRFDGFARMAQVFGTAGIETRHLACPVEWYLSPRGWEDRNDAYLTAAAALFRQATRGALDDAGCKADEIDVVITVSSTGIATPSLDAVCAGELGFRRDILRVPVFGWGCAGGAAGLALATALAATQGGRRVLVVAVELCSLSFRLDVLTKENMVATALFGDGAAAAIIGPSGRTGPRLHSPRQHLWPDTLGIMGWRVQDGGLGVIFDRAIPPFATEHLPAAVAELWPGTGSPAQYICHPGGAKVITALEQALALTEGTLKAERNVLARYGNMSAPTVLFVLDEVRKTGPLDDALLIALGPGFSVAGVRLDGAA